MRLSSWGVGGCEAWAVRMGGAESSFRQEKAPLPRPTAQTNRVSKPIPARFPGHIIHLDVKKVGRIPPEGGWRAHGRACPRGTKASKRGKGTRAGYTYLHTAIDGFSHPAYTKALDGREGLHHDRPLLPRPDLHRDNHLPGLTPPEDPSLHPTAQRQGRALQPHPGRGVPLRAPLLLTAAAPRRRRGVEPPLQLPSTPHHLPQPASRHPHPSTRHQHHDLIQLDTGHLSRGLPSSPRHRLRMP